MLRWTISALAGALLLLPPTLLPAQIELGFRAGIHFDRVERPDRFLRREMLEMNATAGEARTLGLRGGYRFGGGWLVLLDLSRSWNTAWHGHTRLPPPDFTNNTTYVSPRLLYGARLSDRLALDAGLGPALLVSGGTGESNLTRDANPGAALELSPRWRLGRTVDLELSGNLFVFRPEYTREYPPQFVGDATRPAGPEWQQDVHVMVGVRWRP